MTTIITNIIGLFILFTSFKALHVYLTYLLLLELILYVVPLIKTQAGKASDQLYQRTILLNMCSFVGYGLNLTILIIFDYTFSRKYVGIVAMIAFYGTFGFLLPRVIAFYVTLGRRKGK